MARLKGPPDPLEVARFRGVLHYTKDRGLHVVKRWPRKRGSKATPAQLQARANFLKLVRAVEDMMPEDKAIAKELAKGTGYTWRDILSRAVTGELIIIDGVNTVQIQTELDKITNVVGSLIVRTSLGWYGLAPGGEATVLTIPSDGSAVPIWATPAAGGAGGLFAPLLGTVPTAANTGFSAWYNQGSAIVTDAPDGIELTIPASAGNTHHLRGRQQAAPATPYTRTFMLWGCGQNGQSGIGVGFSDGAKADTAHLQGDGLYEATWTNFDSASFATLNSYLTLGVRPLWFFRLSDDGTTAKIEMSLTGNTWRTVWSKAKTGSFLGTSGYSHILFYADHFSAGTDLTLLRFF